MPSADVVCLSHVMLFLLLPAIATALSEVSAAKLFGRLADKKLLLDVPGAGTPEVRNCCHGGCDNCEYSRVFDELNAGRPKWIPLYAERELIDGRRHESTWGALFGDGSLDARAFVDKVHALDYRPSMGPKVKVDDEPLDDDAILALFHVLSDEAGDTISAADVVAALQRITGEQHGVAWKPFFAAF